MSDTTRLAAHDKDVTASAPTTGPMTKYRWVICGLLFFATTFNYLDRQVISYLKEFFCTPVEQGGFGWSNTDFGHLTAAFTGFYAGMTILVGWIIDKIGTKLGLALSLIVWSVFGIAQCVRRAAGDNAHRDAKRVRHRRSGQFSRLPSRRWRSGFRSGSGRWRRAFSTAARISGRWSRRCLFRGA